MKRIVSSTSLAIGIIGITAGFLAQQNQNAPNFPIRPCVNDPTLDIAFDDISSYAVKPCHVFSETYYEARSKFRSAAAQVNAELHGYALEVPKEKSPEGYLDYSIDIAVLPGSLSGLVVHTSGVHGVEGYAGSSVQVSFLESVYPEWKQQKKELPTIVLIHAVNPYGMANYRRTNENNVDLNRNGLSPDEWKEMTKEPKGDYAAYGQLNDFFNPRAAPTWLTLFIGLWSRAARVLVQHGFDSLKAAMVTGQYYNDRGIFYGGTRLEPSLSIIWDFFRNNLLNGKESSCCSGPVTWIDVHTGLGKSGHDTLLVESKPSYNLSLHMQTFFPGAHTPQTSKDAESVQKGYDKTKGLTPNFFSRLFVENGQRQQYLGMVQEFGTVPGVLVAHALIIENQAFHHLPRDLGVEWANATTRRAFYKQTPEWRKAILQRGLRLLFQGVHRSSSSSEILAGEE